VLDRLAASGWQLDSRARWRSHLAAASRSDVVLAEFRAVHAVRVMELVAPSGLPLMSTSDGRASSSLATCRG